MRALIGAVLTAVVSSAAHGSPLLHGTWSAANVNGQPLVAQFEAGGNGRINGESMRWQALGRMLFIEQQGQVAAYSFEVQGDRLSVSGGDLSGVVVLSRGIAAADAAKAKQPKPAPAAVAAAGGQELVGRWCQLSTYTANTGGSSRATCFELKADGTYTYHHEGSMSAQAPGVRGGTASQSSDAGRWRVSGNHLIAHSQRGTVSTYALEKRNHPKNKRDPMICLDGECFVTYYNRPPW